MVESRHNRNQLNIHGNKHTSNAKNDFLDATGTSAIATKFALYTTKFHCGHKHALSQRIKYSWQQTHMYCNIKSIPSQCTVSCGSSYPQRRPPFSLWHYTNLLQRLFQQTQPTHIFGCHNTQISQRINTLVAIKPTTATKYVVLLENLVL
jgi:hypothetical protein